MSKKSTEYDLHKIVGTITRLMSVLNILQKDAAGYLSLIKQSVLLENNISVADILADIEVRNVAKSNKDWRTADAVRDNLRTKGILLKDTADGTIWDVEL